MFSFVFDKLFNLFDVPLYRPFYFEKYIRDQDENNSIANHK
ncbi:hypothetical protein GARC_4295 [Paraglaciecola arctica BSs20135]|uniref:Uncharacterized protein n=1 Tax=Paraglaciecola arctica BSs20135 TaxID=493475 RepID=K6YST5_9ALTE|nr:hypothetical protein GARC_4295 [Paraglaciecola arctica BSs20135]